jgi:hypothetical protein
MAAGDSDFGAALAVAPVLLAQATGFATPMVSSGSRQIFNHRGHGGTRGKAWQILIVVVGCFMVFL